jgi:hypothetical protein
VGDFRRFEAERHSHPRHRAGTQHDGGRMTQVLMKADGTWSIGNIRWGHSDIGQMRKWIRRYEDSIAGIHRQLQPSLPPHHEGEPEKIYRYTIDGGGSVEEAQRRMEWSREYCAKQLARWEERGLLEKLQQDIAKEEANADWRYNALTRMTELATQRLLVFAGDAQGERQRGAMVTGACYICGREG